MLTSSSLGKTSSGLNVDRLKDELDLAVGSITKRLDRIEAILNIKDEPDESVPEQKSTESKATPAESQKEETESVSKEAQEKETKEKEKTEKEKETKDKKERKEKEKETKEKEKKEKSPEATPSKKSEAKTTPKEEEGARRKEPVEVSAKFNPCSMPSGEKPKKPLVLYLFKASPSCRSVWILLKLLDIPHTLKELKAGQHLSQDFAKINPMRTIPTLVDDGFVVADSRAILTYLIDKYHDGDHPLYPREATQRTTINSRLHYDGSTLFRQISDFLRPQLFQKKAPDQEKEKTMFAALANVEKIVEQLGYVAGDCLTLADISIASTITYLNVNDYDISEKFPQTDRYVRQVQADLTGHWAECTAGLDAWKKVLKQQARSALIRKEMKELEYLEQMEAEVQRSKIAKESQ